MKAKRHEAALAYLGRRYSKRGGFITPHDVQAAAVMFSETERECADLERWLTKQLVGELRLYGVTNRHASYPARHPATTQH